MRRGFIAVVASVLLVVATLAGCSSSTSSSSDNLQYKDPPEHQGAYGDRKDELTSELVGFRNLVSTKYDGLEVFQNHFYSANLSIKEDGTGYISKQKGDGTVNTFSLLWEASSEDDLMFYHEDYVREHTKKRNHDVKVYIPIDGRYDPKEEVVYVDGDEYGIGGTMRFRDSSKGLEAPVLWQEGSEHAVASADEVVGSWEISGYVDEDVTAVGEADAIAEWLKDAESTVTPGTELCFERDGSGKMLGWDMEWKIADGGCTITRKLEDEPFSVLKVDDNTLLVKDGGGATYRFKRYE